ncbi:MAG: hypothetical protein DRP15_03155 [Candidatus Aenigmatarchaeota archaeon]|nr:MAG: hypothetical protein DRP15_03155 [Candidatus Aenigmarchaeota archaeon]
MKAQAAFEYLMIFGVIIAFITPVWIYLSSIQSQTNSQLLLSYAKNAAEQIVDAAELVYSQGPPAKIKIKVYIPNVVSANITNNTVIFRVRFDSTITDVYSTSSAPLNGSLPQETGNYWITVEAVDSYVNISY